MDVRHAVGVKSGIPAAKLAALSCYETDPAFSDRERAALQYAEQVTRDDQTVSDECVARLRRHFSEAEVVELTFIVGFQTFASKFAKGMDVAPQGFSS
jgi:alkylhydroperoxidase family enzyme